MNHYFFVIDVFKNSFSPTYVNEKKYFLSLIIFRHRRFFFLIQVNGLFECTPEMLDTLSNRIDYLEKICQKVEASKKRTSPHPKHISSPSPQQQETSQMLNDDSQPAVAPDSTSLAERHSGSDAGDNKDTELRKQTAADDSAEKKFSLSSLLGRKMSASNQQQQQTLISIDPATLESLKSILNVRNQLKSATLDLMDRVKKAEEGVLTNLK